MCTIRPSKTALCPDWPREDGMRDGHRALQVPIRCIERIAYREEARIGSSSWLNSFSRSFDTAARPLLTRQYYLEAPLVVFSSICRLQTLDLQEEQIGVAKHKL